MSSLLQIQAFSDPVTEMYFFIAFTSIIIVMLIVDLGFFNSQSHKISNREAIVWSIVWISISLIFGGFVYYFMGATKASEYLTAFLIEKALSVDNLFVFVLIFGYFQVPDKYQHRVLFWGIIGAIVLRGIFIFSGVWLVEKTFLPEMLIFGQSVRINFILTLFGVFLIYAGIKSASGGGEEEQDFSKNIAVRFIRKILPITKEYHGDKFTIIQHGKRMATPLLLVVAVIETTDLLFAVDSIPAIFAVSNDPFILYTSNIFAILGLRALYFLLANFMDVFVYLKYGLAFILAFIGIKMVASPFYHISSTISLSIVASVLIISSLASVFWKPARTNS